MIHGDIDLTENLDFYKDKRAKAYNNARLSLPDKSSREIVSDNFELVYNVDDYRWNIQSPSYSLTTTNSIVSNISYEIDGHTFTYRWIQDQLDSTINNYNNDWNTTSIGNISTYNTTDNTTVYWTWNNNSGYLQIPCKTAPNDRPSKCAKFFGIKRKKHNSFNGFDNVRERKVYRNTRDFKNHKSKNNRYIDEYYDTYLDLIHGTLHHSIFGYKPESEYDSGIPWLRALKRRSHREYDDYMNELRNGDQDYSSYLTNYGWLGIH